MTIRQIGSSEAKYLAATDLLIGDMSGINYEFLLFDRPVVLLANDWVKKNFPDIGIKTDLFGLNSTIEHSLQNKMEYQEKRKLWLKRTISQTKEKASKRYIEIIINKSKIVNPQFVFVHGTDAVRKTNLLPLVEEAEKRDYKYSFIGNIKELRVKSKENLVIVGAHFLDLFSSYPGYKVHIDHDLKGVASTNIKYAMWDYKRNNYFPHIDLHITPGEAGDRRTKLVLGPLSNRTCIGGYPKGDHLLQLNTIENKLGVYKELNLEDGLPLVTYAPANIKSVMKPGGSLCMEVINYLNKISREAKFHILIKTKYAETKIPKYSLRNMINKLNIFKKEIHDDGTEWRKLFSN